MRSSTIIISVSLSLSLLSAGCADWNRYFKMPGSGDSHYARGRELLQDGQLDAALRELTQAVHADPEYAEAYSAIGDIHRKKGNYSKARDNYKSACKTDPYSFRPHYNLGVTYQAMAELARTLKEVHAYLRKAVQIYIRAVALKPRSFDAHLNLGACYFQLGKTNLAEQQTIKALKINPGNSKANNNLAIMYETQEKLEESILAYKASLEANSQQPGIMLNLGSIYLRLGRLKSALATYRSAARIAPQQAAPYEQMGVCLFRMKRLDDAFDAFQIAIRKNPHSPGAYRGYGVICMYKYICDHSNIELKNRALRAWDFSLKLQPGQQDLIRLIKRFGPVPPPPEKSDTTPSPETGENTPPAPAAIKLKPKPKPATRSKTKNDSKKSSDTWKPDPKKADVQPVKN